ncbi:lysophospholipid acyltransferase family protein [Kitasatospora sp. DSM 101779]|uniref:lysophospholipid acyltransferase family protein n=1 Tax=Kitasatospora sp. DSM 101779 TaxID=2853165 RepID=UPI0021DA6F0D|nr:lysophospholipid acyltransferase family protein [Kitasatospora sp. DSM 101779]MCU7825704.1 1-acyl-sn-glycerol-3-phosphate acyltransferase [Kitasatospora sp. DSM 101779]
MAEFVYPPVIRAALTAFKALDLRVSVVGAEHVPATGGAVLVSNHISYLDFIFAGLGPWRGGKRLTRFMAKDDVFKHRISGPLMRGMRHIPVDRTDGQPAYDAAVEALRQGEIVGVFPEATISRSFMLKKFKTGAARMAADSGAPLLPVILWGTQQLWTKGRPKTLTKRHIPITVMIGEPIELTPQDKPVMVTRRLRAAMGEMLDRAQREYPGKPSGEDDTWWIPAHLGGTAPTLEQAEAAEAAEAAAKAERAAKSD